VSNDRGQTGVNDEPKTEIVFVGWVYGDSECRPPATELPELERDFAASEVWPIVERGARSD